MFQALAGLAMLAAASRLGPNMWFYRSGVRWGRVHIMEGRRAKRATWGWVDPTGRLVLTSRAIAKRSAEAAGRKYGIPVVRDDSLG
jgi:hypothetical protein